MTNLDISKLRFRKPEQLVCEELYGFGLYNEETKTFADMPLSICNSKGLRVATIRKKDIPHLWSNLDNLEVVSSVPLFAKERQIEFKTYLCKT
jgi:hypothetical protein